MGWIFELAVEFIIEAFVAAVVPASDGRTRRYEKIGCLLGLAVGFVLGVVTVLAALLGHL
jgi:hypothetical protein